MTDHTTPVLVLTLTCDDGPGIVAAVSTAIAEQGGNILESSQFGDQLSGRFFMRVRFACTGADTFEAAFVPIAERFSMSWQIQADDRRGRVLIMVSKLDHCLVDLLYQWRTGTMPMAVTGIVSNHRTLRPVAEAHGLPFHHLPVTAQTKPEQEAALLALIERTETELVVLARYMQILSDDLSRRLAGRVINIHHSFLPSFKGARPYHQAHARGVKLIGATAHYVTPELDEGPIIEQGVERVDHADDPAALSEVGRRVEAQVLVRAVRWHLENRILLNGSKTVVFT